MRLQIRNAFRRLTNHFELPSWEVMILILMLTTVLALGVKTSAGAPFVTFGSSSVKTFPDLVSSAPNIIEHDPYDLNNEHGVSETHGRLETGF